jgi:precorrin-6A synthase
VRTVLVIGIGAGDPEQITVQAIRAINRAEVVFVTEKGSEADELADRRLEVLARYLEPGRRPRVVSLPDPPRDRAADDYHEAVERWRSRRAAVWGEAISTALRPDGTGAFLVWGDPCLYDGTIDVLDRIRRRPDAPLELEVIPGITSVQALAARHRVAWNRIGGAVQITTGRRLAAGMPADADDVLVLLDGRCSFLGLAGADLEIYWGAYVGTDDEILVSGPLGQVADRIRSLRERARARKGWIMDAYLLRRAPTRAPDRR